MEFGIGINTGAALAGNMGSHDRMEYLVIGDTVNCTARITGNTPGGKVWIGADTLAKLKNHITVKPLESLSVKGKSEPIPVYEVLDIPNWHPDDLGKITH